MKNNNLFKLTTFILLITIIALILVSGTYAKYTKEFNVTDTATVAKFSVDAKINTTDFSSFSLFDTITEADGATAEADVATGKIAPGTGGKFAINLSNSSEVSVGYTLKFTETENTSSVPIEYSTDGTVWKTATDFSVTGTFTQGDTTQSKDVTVQWRWAFENGISDDEKDTTLGTADIAPTVTVKVSATFTQVD